MTLAELDKVGLGLDYENCLRQYLKQTGVANDPGALGDACESLRKSCPDWTALRRKALELAGDWMVETICAREACDVLVTIRRPGRPA